MKYVITRGFYIFVLKIIKAKRGHRGLDNMVAVFRIDMLPVPITTNVVSSNPAHDEVYSIQHYVIKLVCDLLQVSGFLQYSSFLHQQNWPPRDNWNIFESGVKHHKSKQANFSALLTNCCLTFIYTLLHTFTPCTKFGCNWQSSFRGADLIVKILQTQDDRWRTPSDDKNLSDLSGQVG